MKVRLSVAICLIWGIAAGIAVTVLSAFTQAEIQTLMNVETILCLEFVELGVFLAFIFTWGKTRHLLAYYPGLMIAVPVLSLSYIAVRLMPGLNFSTIGIITGILISVVLIALTYLFRCLAFGKTQLYILIVSGIFAIIAYGGCI